LETICVGDKVLMEFSTFGDRFVSVVADITEDESYMVYSPVPEVVLERLKTDRNVLVKYAFEGRLRGFRTRVLNKVSSATMLMELQKPKRTFEAEERREPRCKCSFPAIVIDGDKQLDGVMEDVSTSCTKIRLMTGGGIPLVTGAENEVLLRFFPFGLKGYEIRCRVIQTFMKLGFEYAVLEFKDEEGDAHRSIMEFVEAQVCCGIPRI